MIATRNNIVFFCFILSFLVNTLSGFGQQTANTWLFGSNVGLSFSTNPPTPLQAPFFYSLEGSSAISDGSGRPLLFSNGVGVYNRLKQLVPDGLGLAGDISSTCNSIIVPLPNNDSIYYVFTVSAAGYLLQLFAYTIVNIKANNDNGIILSKNVSITDPVFEKIAAVRHCNKRDVWIVVRQGDNANYLSYLLTPAGFNPNPVVSSSVVNILGMDNNSIGALKFSPVGDKLAAVYSAEIEKVELMNFDNSTGKLSGGILFKPNDEVTQQPYRGIYGAEFSPSGSLLYVSTSNNNISKAKIFQFSIASMNSTLIENSRIVILQKSGFVAGAMQLGPDKKIYITMTGDSALTTIESPDLPGIGCNVMYQKVLVGFRAIKQDVLESGLPGFIASDLVDKYAGHNFSIIRSPNCENLDVRFTLNYFLDIDSVHWYFGDGTESTIYQPAHTYPAYKRYEIKLKVFHRGCSGPILTILGQSLLFSKFGKVLPPDRALCNDSPLVIRSLVKASNYTWNTGSLSDSIIVNQPGSYTLMVDTDGCISKDTINITKKAPEYFVIREDTTVCKEKSLILMIPSGGRNILWSTGDTASMIIVSAPGTYSVKYETSTTCIFSYPLHIERGDCEIFFPSAFTPNSDGINDNFGLISPTFSQGYLLTIYNRWGIVVFQNTDQRRKWDGKFNGKPASAGTYVWTLFYIDRAKKRKRENGAVLLIR